FLDVAQGKTLLPAGAVRYVGAVERKIRVREIELDATLDERHGLDLSVDRECDAGAAPALRLDGRYIVLAVTVSPVDLLIERIANRPAQEVRSEGTLVHRARAIGRSPAKHPLDFVRA